MTSKRMKFPVQDFPIRGAVLTPAKRAAAVREAVAKLDADGKFVVKAYTLRSTAKPLVKAAAKKR